VCSCIQGKYLLNQENGYLIYYSLVPKELMVYLSKVEKEILNGNVFIIFPKILFV
jgi:hypothetical protein